MIQFYHNNGYSNDRFTVAVIPPSRHELLAMVANGQDHISFSFALTHVHPKDRFVKKIGREVSSKKLINTQFHFSEVELDNGRTRYHLYTTLKQLNKTFGVRIVFSTVSSSNTPHTEVVWVLG